MLASEGSATDPASWGQFFGALGPGGFALVLVSMGVLVVLLIVVGFLLFWRGSEKFGFVGFGAEYQKNRLAQERQALAMERTEAAQEDIKGLLAKLAPFAEVVAQWLRDSMLATPARSPVSQSGFGQSACDSEAPKAPKP